jgi:hypothetical protein
MLPNLSSITKPAGVVEHRSSSPGRITLLPAEFALSRSSLRAASSEEQAGLLIAMCRCKPDNDGDMSPSSVSSANDQRPRNNLSTPAISKAQVYIQSQIESVIPPCRLSTLS